MRSRICAIGAFALILSLFPFGKGFAAEENDSEFAHWRELRAGQTCYMDSVFEGTAVKRIRVKFISTTPHPILPDERAIIIELTDPYISKYRKGSTPVAGTSGSPVYCKARGKWRLVGAAAFMFSDFPTSNASMGVTPIDLMIARRIPPVPNASLPNTTFDYRLSRNFEIKWLPIYLDNVAASAQGSSEENPASRRPAAGDSVTVLFPDGSGAICTVTYVRGDKFWACGHGILPWGPLTEQRVSYPSYRTEIARTEWSAKNSFKIFSRNLEFFGTIIKNTPFAIEGTTREK